MEDAFERDVRGELHQEQTAAAAMTAVVVEGDEIEQHHVDGRMMMMMMGLHEHVTTTGQKISEEPSLDQKQPIDDDDDDDSTISKTPLQETEPPCLAPPVECTHSEEVAGTSSITASSTSTSSEMLAEEPRAPEAEPTQNSRLDALFQAIEMAHEIPVGTNTEAQASCRAPSLLSVMDQDIFADSPNDDSINNIPVPRCGEDAAGKLPRSALNLFVYGPTPPHMAEAWHKMYGRRWQDHS